MITVLEILIDYREALLSGLWVTFKICLYTWTLGIVFGVVLGVLSSRFRKWIGGFTASTGLVVGGAPVLVLLFRLYFPLQQFLQITMDPFVLAVGCFVLVNTLLVAKIIRQGIDNLPQQYMTSARLAGLSKQTIITKIQLPLLFKHVVAPIIMVQIAMLHNSIFASLINVNDIFRQIQRINAIIYKPIELYTIVALLFIIISIPLYLTAKKLTYSYPTTA